MKLLHGNNLELLRTLPDNSVDSIVTDPPYGLGKEPDALAMLRDWMEHGHHDVKSKKGFMGKTWDNFVPQPVQWKECLRVLKPGGHVLAFAGTRTQDLMALGLRIAGFEIRDLVAWVYGCLSEDTEVLTDQGWVRYQTGIHHKVLAYDVENDIYQWEKPERWNEYRVESDTAYHIVSDTTDQIVSRGHRCLVEREGRLVFVSADELLGMESMPALPDDLFGIPEAKTNLLQQPGSQEVRARPSYHTSVATVTPIAYKGSMWCPTVSTGAFVARRKGKVFVTGNSGFPKVKTVLKPALEPITLARKPGRSELQIDLCRVPTEDNLNGGAYSEGQDRHDGKENWRFERKGGAGEFQQPQGRWPANVIHDGSDEVLALFPDSKGQQGDLKGHSKQRESPNGCYGKFPPAKDAAARKDSGSAARFFYCAKTNSKDRNEGCEHLPDKAWKGENTCIPERENRPFNPSKNNHPTVKPTELMRYLCRLVTPPGGTILDPWMGSGSTGKAAKLEGFHFIGMEQDEGYFRIAQARCDVEAFSEEDFWG